jgi:hypothetical protein
VTVCVHLVPLSQACSQCPGDKRVATAEQIAVLLGPPHQMDAPDGPLCRCGQPSRHESGWCGECRLPPCPRCGSAKCAEDAALGPDPDPMAGAEGAP